MDHGKKKMMYGGMNKKKKKMTHGGMHREKNLMVVYIVRKRCTAAKLK